MCAVAESGIKSLQQAPRYSCIKSRGTFRRTILRARDGPPALSVGNNAHPTQTTVVRAPHDRASTPDNPHQPSFPRTRPPWVFVNPRHLEVTCVSSCSRTTRRFPLAQPSYYVSHWSFATGFHLAGRKQRGPDSFGATGAPFPIMTLVPNSTLHRF